MSLSVPRSSFETFQLELQELGRSIFSLILAAVQSEHDGDGRDLPLLLDVAAAGSQWRQDFKKKAHLDALVLAETAGECQGDVSTAAWVERHAGGQERESLDCPAARTRSHGGSLAVLPLLTGQPSVCHHEVTALSAGLPVLQAAELAGTQHAQTTASALDLDSAPCVEVKGSMVRAAEGEGGPSHPVSRPLIVPAPPKTDAASPTPSSSDNTSTTTAETCRESLSPCSVVEDHSMVDVGGARLAGGLATATEGQELHAPNSAMLLDCLAVSAACLPAIVPTRKRCGRPPVCEPSCARRVKR